MTRTLALTVTIAAVLAGCGGPDAAEVARETGERLGDIRSGTLDLRLDVEGSGGGEDTAFGLELAGPFALPESDGLPVADLEYTQSVGDASETTTVVSTGEEAWVDGAPLTADQAARLELSAGRANPLDGLDIGAWLVDPELGEEGDGTVTVTGALDVARALADVAELTGTSRFSDAEAERLAEATRDSRLTIVTGAEDRLLRRLDADVRLELEVAERLREALGPLVGGAIRLRMEIAGPNEPVEVSAPG